MNDQSEGNRASLGKQRLSLQLQAELVEGARDAAYWTPGLTLNALAGVALSYTLACMKLLCGGRLPPRAGSLKVGRRVR